MHSFDLSRPTLVSFIAIHLYFLLIIFLYWRRYTSNSQNSNRPSVFGLLFTIFLVFAFDGGDFYNYYNFIHNRDLENLEIVYHYILRAINYNYLVFRLIVWGGALCLFQETVSRFGLEKQRTSFFLFAAFISVFDYARASLAMSVFFWGVSFLLIPKSNKVISFILGISLMIASVFFHHSMLIALVAAFISLFIPMDRKYILIILVVFLLLSSFFGTWLNSIVGASLFNDAINNKIEGYSIQEYDNYFSVYEWIRRYIEYGVFFIPFIITCYKYYYQRNSVPSSFHGLFKICFVLILFAVSVLLIPNLTFVLFYRILFLCMIPVVILFCHCEQSGYISNGTYKSVLFLGIIYLLFGFAKRILGGSLSM